MKFSKMIFVLTIAFSVIFVLTIGSSYAYYVSTDGTTVNVTTGSIDTGASVVFAQSQYINVNTGVPIAVADVNTLASSSVFTVTPNKEILGSEASMTISLIDLYIDSALKVSDFKYRFTCNNGTSSSTLKEGTGSDFTDDVISQGYMVLGTMSTDLGTLDVNKIYTCDLKVWLQESGVSQNTLMNKKFRGLIKVSTLFKGK